MQATSTTRRFHLHFVWAVAAIAAVLLGAVLAGVITTMSRDDSSPAPVPSIVEPKTNENVHFAEMNAFPDTAVARTRSADRKRFIEMNLLHDVSTAPVKTYERLRFEEMNASPAGAAPLIPPTADRPGERD
jgi:hypothetical protein